MDLQLGHRIQLLRKRSGMSLRSLAEQSGVATGMISYVERGQTSPSLATLQKILSALGTDLGSFFATEAGTGRGPVFPREQMQMISDRQRSYTMLLTRQPGIRLEMLDEEIRPSRKKPEFETLACDVAGYVLSGKLTLEFEHRKKQTVRPGDAFYVTKGTTHRGYASGDDPVRLVTVYHPPRY
jgi:transcriptional regulator with XRE-family HTH domain